MKERFEWVKEHFQNHKTVYLCGLTAIGTLGVAGITYTIMRGRGADLQSGSDGLARATVRPLSFFSNTGDIVTTVHTGHRGHPGFRIRSLEFMTDYDTQAEVAKIFNISPSALSSHLNGKFDNVNGLHFERIAV